MHFDLYLLTSCRASFWTLDLWGLTASGPCTLQCSGFAHWATRAGKLLYNFAIILNDEFPCSRTCCLCGIFFFWLWLFSSHTRDYRTKNQKVSSLWRISRSVRWPAIAANQTRLSCTRLPMKSSKLARQTLRAKLLKVCVKSVTCTCFVSIDISKTV